jgi:3-oxoacyl-[acyl-carrier protein] reductase
MERSKLMAEFKTAVVTGASRGIGAGIARRLAQDGFAVVVNYAGNATAAADLVGQIEADGGRAKAVQADIRSADDMKALFETTQSAFGGVDVLVNNAGIMELGDIATYSDEAFERVIDINLKGTFHGIREAANRLRDSGRIINVSTSVIGLYHPGYGVYAASKSAVEALTHIVAKELGPRGITVNAVAPGPVATELFFNGKDEATLARICAMNPMGRLGEVPDIANVVSFLAGPDSAWVTGQIVRANGGVV